MVNLIFVKLLRDVLSNLTYWLPFLFPKILSHSSTS